MSLVKYKQKRAFNKTPEPTGGKAKNNELRFVIQKHAASHLHYDFRLEMEGVLKSWAVPKGPSTDPAVKRLAMMVEDHPYDYRTFEGIIPEGQYGGGTVIIWDEGTYEDLDEKTNDKRTTEKNLLKQLKSGSLKFKLKGKKLKGEFALVRTNGMGENSWLLIKHKDKYASKEDITKKDRSVLSRKTIAGVAKTSHNIYGETKRPAAKRTAGKTAKKEDTRKPAIAIKRSVKKETAKPGKTAQKKSAGQKNLELKQLMGKANKQPFPTRLKPMLATLVDRPFDREGWLYEIKWDGYRSLAFMNKNSVELRSRNDLSFNEKFYSVYDALKALKLNAVIDGEIVVLNNKGVSDFGALQNWRSEADGDLVFYAFDILWLNGYSLTSLSLEARKQVLKTVLTETDTIRISEAFDVQGTDFFNTIKQMGLEGIIAKKADSTYSAGERNTDWLKIKSNKRQEVIIGGFTRNDGTSKSFSSLLVGVYKGKKLMYTGKIGTGFSDQLQKELMKQFKPLIATKSPFTSSPDINKASRFRPNPPHATATWLQPKLVCEVSFAEMTSDGVMRHPSFEGMRSDKKTKDVVLEKEKHTTTIIGKQAKAAAKGRKTFLNPNDKTQVREINGNELKLTNLDKIYWPGEKISKRDMLNYYYQVAPYMLPYLINRPMSLNRHPDGIKGFSFYQKDVTGKVPGWVKQFPYKTEGVKKNFMVCTSEASLLYMASLGCIEINPWSSTIQNPDHPDWCLIDLDPGKKSTFEHVIETAQVVKQVLDELKVPSCCKTSGSTGLHIYIPLNHKYTYEESKEFARLVAKLVQQRLPKMTSLERTVAKRGGKLYIDFLQNRPQATLAAPYSLRPKPGATVSMPLHWHEVKKGLKMKDFTISNAIKRIKAEGDLFKPVLGKGINMVAILKRLEKLSKDL
ncbi:MAG: DNA ligase D [Bacteroidota bacterium]